MSKHRKILEEHLGRKLESWEEVHHRNGDHSDDRPENLEPLTKPEHFKLHRLGNPEKPRKISARNAPRATQTSDLRQQSSFPRPFEDVWEEPLEIALGR